MRTGLNSVIGMFDSGIGGLGTLAALRQELPGAKLVYIADSEHCPYGERSEEELLEITTDVTKRLVRAGATMVVIACNTATTKCIHELRKRFPQVIFVGTEPAIKVACDRGFGNILLMATPNTIGSAQVQRLVDRYITDEQSLTLLPCPGLAKLIEDNSVVAGMHDGCLVIDGDASSDAGTVSFNEESFVSELDKKLQRLFMGLPDLTKYDAVVLGCTHYVHIAPWLKRYFPNAELLDGNTGVAKRAKALLGRSVTE